MDMWCLLQALLPGRFGTRYFSMLGNAIILKNAGFLSVSTKKVLPMGEKCTLSRSTAASCKCPCIYLFPLFILNVRAAGSDFTGDATLK